MNVPKHTYARGFQWMLLRVSVLPFICTLGALLWLAYTDETTSHPQWFSQLSHALMVILPLTWGLSLWWGWRRAQQLTNALEQLVAGHACELPIEFSGLARHLTSLRASLQEIEGNEASRQAILRRFEVHHRTIQRLTHDRHSADDLEVWAQGLRDSLESSFPIRSIALWIQDGKEFVWSIGDEKPEQTRRRFAEGGRCWNEPDEQGKQHFYIELEARYEPVYDLPKPIRLIVQLSLNDEDPPEETRERLDGIAGLLSVSWSNWTLYQELQSRVRISREVIESLDDGVLLLDRRGKILGANRAAGTLLGTSAEALAGQPFEERLPLSRGGSGRPAGSLGETNSPPVNLENEHTWVQAIQQKKPIGPFERSLPRPGQPPVECLVLTYATETKLKTSGGLALTVVLRDITRQRELENLRSDFTATLSHELRTPLTSMKGYLQTLMHRKARQFDMDKVQSIVSVINGQADHLQRLIQELLEAAKMRTQDLEIHVRPVHLPQLLEESLIDSTSDQRISKQIICPDAVWVACDPERIHSVLSHLLSNAEKYSLPGGTVTLGCKLNGQMASIWVQDEGVGIPLDQQEKIFEMFHRLDTGDRRTFYGVGIGLYLARKVVDGHGGRITVDSAPGKGAKFTFTLPLCPPESEDPGGLSAEPATGGAPA